MRSMQILVIFLMFILTASWQTLAQAPPSPGSRQPVQETRTHGSENPFSNTSNAGNFNWKKASASQKLVVSAECRDEFVLIKYSDATNAEYKLLPVENCRSAKVSPDQTQAAWIIEKKGRNRFFVDGIEVVVDKGIRKWAFLKPSQKIGFLSADERHLMVFDLKTKKIIEWVDKSCITEPAGPKCPYWVRLID